MFFLPIKWLDRFVQQTRVKTSQVVVHETSTLCASIRRKDF